MIGFANAKINIGLHVTERRPDGYHHIETVFYPVKLYDVVEVIPASGLTFKSYQHEFAVGEDNLCTKAFKLVKEKYKIPDVDIRLLKQIPVGAGLGGGSADASFMLKLLNEMFSLNIKEETLEGYASQLGADCPFFIKNKPMYASGIGDVLEPISLDLSSYQIVIVKPDIHISTADAYKNIVPRGGEINLRSLSDLPIGEWKFVVENHFEFGLFKKFPQIQKLKSELYELGAEYAAMTGSGSAVYGIFKKLPDTKSLSDLGAIYLPVDLSPGS